MTWARSRTDLDLIPGYGGPTSPMGRKPWPSEMDTSPASCGSTPRSPIPRRLRASTGACSGGSSGTRCRLDRRCTYYIGAHPRRRRRRDQLDLRGRSADGAVEHLCMGRQRRRHRVEGPRGRRQRSDGAGRRDGRRGAWLCSPIPRGRCSACGRQIRHKGARVVNEHGALNFNSLNTRDPATAKSFYGSVFGWETLTLDGGAEMWTLPGYGDYLERDTPGLRKMVAEVGAPERFVAKSSPASCRSGRPRRRAGADSFGRRRRVFAFTQIHHRVAVDKKSIRVRKRYLNSY